MLSLLTACVPEADEALKLHDIALYSNASDLNGLYGYLYGKPQTVMVGGQTYRLSDNELSQDRFSVPSALLVNGQPSLKQPLAKRSPPPSRVRRIPLTTDVQLEVGEATEEILYFDGAKWFTLVSEGKAGMTTTVTPRERLTGLKGVGELTQEEASTLEAILEPRAPVAVTVIADAGIAKREVDGLAEYLSTALYVQQTLPTDEAAYVAPERDLLWEVFAEGSQAVGADTASYLLITNQAELLSAWNRAYGSQLTVPPLPDVNFGRETLLAVFLDTKPSGGYSINITDISLDGRDIYADVEQLEPAPDALSTQALTTPWTMVRVLRGDVSAAWFRDPNTGELFGVAQRID